MPANDLESVLLEAQMLHEKAAEVIRNAQQQVRMLHRLQDARIRIVRQRIQTIHEIIFFARLRRTNFKTDGTVH